MQQNFHTSVIYSIAIIVFFIINMLCFIYCSRLIIVTLDEEYPVYLVCVWKKLKNAVFFTIQFIFTTIYYTKSNKNITS